jgi:wyosine [tRNA(Phe)-imidazoG37] synthetase (radical SAM superfamily)
MFKYVFGPVPSRRFGRSLGVNVVPLKYCNWNCVYCQLGRTNYFVNSSINFFNYEEIEGEIEIATKMYDYDYLTFIGDGEPTLYNDLGKLIKWSKENQPKKVAVFTNGARLKIDEIRDSLSYADVVKVSHDAGSEKVFRIVDRPYRDIHFDEFIDSLKQFRKQFKGEIWSEVMLVRGINDKEDELERIGKSLALYSPDKVHIMVPTRPPAEPWAIPPDSKTILKAGKILSEYVKNVYIIDYIERGEFYVDKDDPINGILNILKIQPMTEDEIKEISMKYNVNIDNIKEKAKEMVFDGVKYYVY